MVYTIDIRRKAMKKEVKYYKMFLENGRQVHFKDGTPRLVTDRYIENNSRMFDHNKYMLDHMEIVKE